MTELTNIVAAHASTLVWLFIGYLVFMALVGGMPEPTKDSGFKYRWLYGSLHILALNWKFGLKLVKIPVPEEENHGKDNAQP